MGAVTEHGPEGYDYQYLGSLYVILHYLQTGGLTEVLIDKLGKEDLTLVFSSAATSNKFVEVQFKNRSAAFTEDLFLSCITKFTAHRHDQNILSRLAAGPDTSFIVLTSSINSGFAGPLNVLATPYSFEKSRDKREKKAVSALRGELDKEYRGASTPQQKKRQKFLERQKNALTDDQFSTLLDRITLIDRLSKAECWMMIGHSLSNLLVPVPAQRMVILEVLEIIKANRGKGTDVLPLLQQLIDVNRKHLPTPDATYLDRGDETTLLQTLKTEHVLLMTGLPLCGKTQTALRIAQLLTAAEPTIDYFMTTSIREAERLMNDNSVGAKVCYLEDPISTEGEASKDAYYRQLDALVRGLPKGRQRFIIVTERSEESDKIFRHGYLNAFSWKDRSVSDGDFLLRLWAKLREGLTTSAKLQVLITSLIKDDSVEEQVQPGQLVYLSRNLAQLKLIDRESLLHVIHFRAEDITRSLLFSAAEAIDAMLLLGISASTQYGPREFDLRYFSDPRKDYFPGINQNELIGVSSTFSGRSAVPNYRQKQYEGLPTKADDLRTGLSSLLDKGFIRCQNLQYIFSHPIYREAARELFDPEQPIRFEKAMALLRKSIGSLNAQTAMQASRMLTFVAGRCKMKEDLLSLCLVAEMGLMSTFQPVRDRCLLFLIYEFDSLSGDLQNKIKDEVRNRGDVRNEHFVWQDDVTFIPDVVNLETEWFSGDLFLDIEFALLTWEALQIGAPLPNNQTAWKLLLALDRATEGKKARILYDLATVEHFLRYSEIMIRELAAYLIAASATDSDVPTLEAIFAREDPFVNYQLIKGLFRSWPYFKDPVVKDAAKTFLVQAYDNLFIVLSSIEFFSQFSAGHTNYTFDWRDDIEDAAVADMWFLWGELMPVFFKHLPPSIHLHNSRFIMTFRESQVSDAAIVKIFIAYFGWLRAHTNVVKHLSSLSEDALDLFFFYFQRIDPVQRLSLIKEAVAMGGEVFRAKGWRLLIYHWPVLTADEQHYLLSLLSGLSINVKAIVLTTENIPGDVQQQLLGATTDGKPIEEVIRLFPEKLLLACLASLYVMEPFNSFEHRDASGWGKILETYLHQPEHPAFIIALRTFFDDQLIYGISPNTLWPDPQRTLDGILTHSSSATREVIFFILLTDLAETVGSNAKPFWELLEPHLTVDEVTQFSAILDQHVEAISIYSNLPNIPSPFVLALDAALSLDLMVLEVLQKNWVENWDAETKKAFAKVHAATMKMEKIRTLQATEAFQRWAQQNRTLFSTEDMAIVEGYRSILVDKARNQRHQLRHDLHQRLMGLMEPY